MAWPTSALPIAVELYDGTTWQDITSDTRGGDIAIKRGQADEASAPEPASIALTLDNRDGTYSPRNPTSSLYGKIGRNTPVRVRLTDGAAGDSFFSIESGFAFASTADNASLDVTGDIDIRIDILGAATPGAAGALLASKYATASNQRSWAFVLNSNGTLTFRWSPDGTSGSELTATSTTTAGLVDYSRKAVRVALDVNNGASGHTTTFYTSDSISGTWVQLGSAVTVAGTTSIFSSSSAVAIGGLVDLVSFNGYLRRIYAFEMRSGIGGAVVTSPDFRRKTAGETSLVDAQGRTWQWSGVGGRIVDPGQRGYAEVSEWPPRWDVSGRDSTVSVTAQGILRRLGQGNHPVRSPRTSETLLNHAAWARAYWTMEDGTSATLFASALSGGQPLRYSGVAPDFASLGPLLGSDKIPVLSATTVLSGSVPAYSPSISPVGIWAIFVIDVPPSPTTLSSPWVNNTPILWVQQSTSGSTVATWEVRYKTGAGGDLEIRALDASGTQLATSGTLDFNIDGGQFEFSFGVNQSGSNAATQIALRYIDGSGATQTHSLSGGAFAGLTVTAATAVRIAPTGGLSELAVGHLLISENSTVGQSIVANAGEQAADRASRLCTEIGVPIVIARSFLATDTVAMGAQAIPSTFVDSLAETYLADDALLYETRDALGLSFRGRETLYNQPVALTLSYTGRGEIAADLQPIDDDQRTRNRVTARRRSGDATGSSAIYEDSASRMGTQAPPDGVGLYDDSVDLNLYDDTRLLDQAMWRVHVGTWDEARYPTVAINMAALAAAGRQDLLAAAALLDLGDRIQLTNLPIWTGATAGTIDLLVVGFGPDSFIHPIGWDLTLNCVPYGPYHVGIWGNGTIVDDDTPRWDGSNSATSGSFNTGSLPASLTVATSSGNLWTTTGGHFPLKCVAAGVVLTVSAISGASSPQTFTVTAASASKTIPSGSAVHIYRPVVYPLL